MVARFEFEILRAMVLVNIFVVCLGFAEVVVKDVVVMFGSELW